MDVTTYYGVPQEIPAQIPRVINSSTYKFLNGFIDCCKTKQKMNLMTHEKTVVLSNSNSKINHASIITSCSEISWTFFTRYANKLFK